MPVEINLMRRQFTSFRDRSPGRRRQGCGRTGTIRIAYRGPLSKPLGGG